MGGVLELLVGLFVVTQQAHERRVAVVNGVEDGQTVVQNRVLRRVDDVDAAPDGACPGVQRLGPGDEFQQSRFAAAIAANQPHPVALVDEQVDGVEQDPFAKLFADVFQGDEVHEE